MNIQDGFARLHGTDPQPTPTPELLARWADDPAVEELYAYFTSLIPAREMERCRITLWAELLTKASIKIIGPPTALTSLARALRLGDRFPESSVIDDDGMATLELSIDDIQASYRTRLDPESDSDPKNPR